MSLRFSKQIGYVEAGLGDSIASVLDALARYMIPLVHQHAGYGAGHHPVGRLLAEPLGLRAKHLANAGAIHIDVQVNMPVYY
jgi:cobalamin biosynthesis protein CbiG